MLETRNEQVTTIGSAMYLVNILIYIRRQGEHHLDLNSRPRFWKAGRFFRERIAHRGPFLLRSRKFKTF